MKEYVRGKMEYGFSRITNKECQVMKQNAEWRSQGWGQEREKGAQWAGQGEGSD